jgi:hypothetical protein
MVPPLERKVCSLSQYFARICCQIRSSFPMLPWAALVRPAVIIVSFLDGASLRQLMGQCHLTTLEIAAIFQAYFRHSKVSKHAVFWTLHASFIREYLYRLGFLEDTTVRNPWLPFLIYEIWCSIWESPLCVVFDLFVCILSTSADPLDWQMPDQADYLPAFAIVKTGQLVHCGVFGSQLASGREKSKYPVKSCSRNVSSRVTRGHPTIYWAFLVPVPVPSKSCVIWWHLHSSDDVAGNL